MGLAVYYKDENDQFVEVDSEAGVYITTTHDGKNGDVKVTQLYLRNDDASKWFSNILIKPYDLIEPYDINYEETGWGVKLSEGSNELTSAEWENKQWAEQISMGSIGSDSSSDTTTYFSFWYYITCPPNEDVKIKTDIILDVSYTENSVI